MNKKILFDNQPSKEEKRPNKKVLSFFTLAFPTIIIFSIGMLEPSAWWASLLLAFYQFVMLKQFLDSYYEVY